MSIQEPSLRRKTQDWSKSYLQNLNPFIQKAGSKGSSLTSRIYINAVNIILSLKKVYGDEALKNKDS